MTTSMVLIVITGVLALWAAFIEREQYKLICLTLFLIFYVPLGIAFLLNENDAEKYRLLASGKATLEIRHSTQTNMVSEVVFKIKE